MLPNLRTASLDDLPPLMAMVEEYYRHDGLAFHEAEASAAAKTLIGQPDLGRIWIIESDGAAAGYVVLAFSYSLEFHGRKAFLDELYLRERFRRMGVGAMVIGFLLEFCAAEKIRALRLEVETENEAAQRLYAKMGFVQHDRYLMTRWL